MKSEFKIYETTATDHEGNRYYVQLEKRQARRNCNPKFGVRAFRLYNKEFEDYLGYTYRFTPEIPAEPNRWFKSEEEALEWAEYILAKHYGGHLGEKLLDDSWIFLARSFKKEA